MLEDWIGRREEVSDIVDRVRSFALSATLGEPAAPTDAMPPLHHWLLFWSATPPGETGIDGHPRRGGFLPPIEAPRRMWAGGAVDLLKPLLFGERIRKISEITGIKQKSGASGALVFVTVAHEIHGESGLAIRERQDLVYRDMPTGAAPPVPAADVSPAWREDKRIDPILLFRFSALTFNSHRIHYDRDFATGTEFYPGLVVHGPLQAVLMMTLYCRYAGRQPASFEYRGVSPAFDLHPISVCGSPESGGAQLWVEQNGSITMKAHAAGA